MVMLYIVGIVTIVKGYQNVLLVAVGIAVIKNSFFCESKDSEQKKCDSDSDGHLSCSHLS